MIFFIGIPLCIFVIVLLLEFFSGLNAKNKKREIVENEVKVMVKVIEKTPKLLEDTQTAVYRIKSRVAKMKQKMSQVSEEEYIEIARNADTLEAVQKKLEPMIPVFLELSKIDVNKFLSFMDGFGERPIFMMNWQTTMRECLNVAGFYSLEKYEEYLSDTKKRFDI